MVEGQRGGWTGDPELARPEEQRLGVAFMEGPVGAPVQWQQEGGGRTSVADKWRGQNTHVPLGLDQRGWGPSSQGAWFLGGDGGFGGSPSLGALSPYLCPGRESRLPRRSWNAAGPELLGPPTSFAGLGVWLPPLLAVMGLMSRSHRVNASRRRDF